ncbi:hypothetical protein [Isoptericola sp. NPDC055881]
MTEVTERPQTPTRPVEHGAYRAWLRTGAREDWVDRAADHVGAWLRSKDQRLDVDLSRGDGVHMVAVKTIIVRHQINSGKSAFRLAMVEGVPGSRYNETSLAHEEWE